MATFKLAIGIAVIVFLLSGAVCHQMQAIKDCMQHTDRWRKFWSASIVALDGVLEIAMLTAFFFLVKWYMLHG